MTGDGLSDLARVRQGSFCHWPNRSYGCFGAKVVQGMGEQFSANPATGSASLSIPLPLSPGRDGVTPKLSLSYDSGSGNGPFGMGWSLSVPAVSRKTSRGLPRYLDGGSRWPEESDTFQLSDSEVSGGEDLVPDTGTSPRTVTDADGSWTVHRYRPIQVMVIRPATRAQSER